MALNLGNLLPRQVIPTSVDGCDLYDYTSVDSCIYGAISATNYPSCYDYYTDKACCSTWLSWEISYLGCLQTAYSNCFDYTDYASAVSDYLPCYTDSPLTEPATAHATTTASAISSVPKLILEAISTGPPTTMPPHDPVPSYTGSGNLLQGYCSSVNYVLLDGPTAFWAPLVGCVDDKPDCCPYSLAPSTTTGPSATTITVVSTVTVDASPGGTTSPPFTGNNAYPVPAVGNQATLQHCPGDYISVSGGCCPSGYQLWNAPVGGQIPCYSSLKDTLSPPPVPVTPLSIPVSRTSSQPATANGTFYATTSIAKISSLLAQKPTSAIVNIVYAVAYSVQPASGLSTGAKAGIGAGAGVAGLAIIALSGLLFWRTRKHKKDKAALTAVQATGPVAQAPGDVQPQNEAVYDQQQMQQNFAPGTYYDPKQPTQQVAEIYGQPTQGYGQPPTQIYGQPPTQVYGQPPTQVYGQPPTHAYVQPPTELYGQSPTTYSAPPYEGQGQPPLPYSNPPSEMQAQTPISYPTPPVSAVSPAPGSGYQTGYASPGSVTSELAGQPQHGHQIGSQAGYAPPQGPPITYSAPSTTGSPPPGQGYSPQQNYSTPIQHQAPPETQELTGQSRPNETGT